MAGTITLFLTEKRGTDIIDQITLSDGKKLRSGKNRKGIFMNKIVEKGKLVAVVCAVTLLFTACTPGNGMSSEMNQASEVMESQSDSSEGSVALSSVAENEDTVSSSTGSQEASSSEIVSQQIPEKEIPVTLYIGMNGDFEEYPVKCGDELTPELLIAGIADLTGWDLSLADEVTTGKGGMTVSFSKACSLFTGPPDPQKEEFYVYDAETLDQMILDSIQKTLQYNFVDPVLGNPESLDIYYCMEGDQPLYLENIDVTIPMTEPYHGLDSVRKEQEEQEIQESAEESSQ